MDEKDIYSWTTLPMHWIVFLTDRKAKGYTEAVGVQVGPTSTPTITVNVPASARLYPAIGIATLRGRILEAAVAHDA